MILTLDLCTLGLKATPLLLLMGCITDQDPSSAPAVPSSIAKPCLNRCPGISFICVFFSIRSTTTPVQAATFSRLVFTWTSRLCSLIPFSNSKQRVLLRDGSLHALSSGGSTPSTLVSQAGPALQPAALLPHFPSPPSVSPSFPQAASACCFSPASVWNWRNKSPSHMLGNKC